MISIRDDYIPYLVKEVIKTNKPKTEEEFVDFCQALYDQIKIKEKELEINIKSN